MRRLWMFILTGFLFAAPHLLASDYASLKICNIGAVEIYVAVASRIQLPVTGYEWRMRGWYAVPVHGCTVVYSEEYEPAGPITPQSGARLAYTITKNGWWGAYHTDVQSGGWMRSGSGEICVKRGETFDFTRPAGDPAAECNNGFNQRITIPVADEFVPDRPGNFQVAIDWDGSRFFVPLGVEEGTRARLIFGEEVYYDHVWRFANGAALPDSLTRGSLPPLLPKAQSAVSGTAVAAYIKQVQNLTNSFHCTDPGGLLREVLSVRFTMDDYGIVSFANTKQYSFDRNPRTQTSGAALANLDLDTPEMKEADDTCRTVLLPCKDNARCARSDDNYALGALEFYVNDRDQLDRIIAGLKRLAPYYPEGRGDIH